MPQTVSQNSLTGNWKGVIVDGKLKCTIYRSAGTGGISPGNAVFDLQEITPRPVPTIHEYTIRRDAGTLTLKGDWKDKEGAGSFTLVPNDAFMEELKKQLGFSITDPELRAHLFYTNLNKDYFAWLAKNGYRIGSETQLLNLAVHGEGLEGFSSYMKQLSEKGYPAISLDQYIQDRVHGIDINYINGLEKLGFAHIPLEKLMQLKTMQVTPEYILEFEKVGCKITSLDQAIDLKANKVNAAYIAEMQKKGYKNLSLSQYRDLRSQNK